MNKTVEEYVKMKAAWIDSIIKERVPKWKLNLLIKINNPIIRGFMAKLIRADVEIINEELIGDFGTRTLIRLNGYYIAKRNFK